MLEGSKRLTQSAEERILNEKVSSTKLIRKKRMKSSEQIKSAKEKLLQERKARALKVNEYYQKE